MYIKFSFLRDKSNNFIIETEFANKWTFSVRRFHRKAVRMQLFSWKKPHLICLDCLPGSIRQSDVLRLGCYSFIHYEQSINWLTAIHTAAASASLISHQAKSNKLQGERKRQISYLVCSSHTVGSKSVRPHWKYPVLSGKPGMNWKVCGFRW